jgi:hypothetical protein
MNDLVKSNPELTARAFETAKLLTDNINLPHITFEGVYESLLKMTESEFNEFVEGV